MEKVSSQIKLTEYENNFSEKTHWVQYSYMCFLIFNYTNQAVACAIRTGLP